MNDVLVIAAGFAAAAVATELLVRDKVQSGLTRVVIVHCVAFAAAALAIHTLPMAATFVFWTGMLLFWFGMRSHVESSILLRMLTSLRGGPASRADILQQYADLYSRAHRVDELVRAGLVRPAANGLAPTAKGRFVAQVARLLG